MRIKKGDVVVVLTGKDRGKKAPVAKVLVNDQVVVEGLNLKKKHQRPRRQGQKGQIISVASPLHRSNVALWCSSCGRGVRVGAKISAGKKIRVCKRCGREM